MSGFEVAGIVLGAIPIVVEGLRSYNKTRSFIRRYRNKTALIDALINNLKYYAFSINEQVVKVLDGANISLSEDDIRSGRAIDLLRAPQKKAQIERYLGLERLNLFVVQLKACQAVLAELIAQFEGLVQSAYTGTDETEVEGLQRLIITNQLTQYSTGHLSSQALKFSYKKGKIDSQVLALRRAVERLRDPDLQSPNRFVVADYPSTEINSNSLKSLVRSFEDVQRQATRLYSALASTLPGSCHQSHSIRLFLEERTDVLHQRRIEQENRFRIELLGYLDPGCSTLDAANKYTVSVNKLDEQDNDEQQCNRASIGWEMTSTRSKNLQQVNILCVSIKTAAANQRRLEFLLSHDGSLYCSEYKTVDIASEIISKKSPIDQCISLEEVIKRTGYAFSPERNWSFRQRMVLALRLACSLLQLNCTHWLSRSLASSSVYFQYTSPANEILIPGAGPPFEADQPFVVQSDLPGFCGTQPDPLAHPCVLNLSIVLMELWRLETFQQYLERRVHAAAYSSSSTSLPYDEHRQLADSWLKDLEVHLPPQYKRAVRRCIEIASRTYIFEDPEFREDFCEGVIKPLWENCRLWLR